MLKIIHFVNPFIINIFIGLLNINQFPLYCYVNFQSSYYNLPILSVLTIFALSYKKSGRQTIPKR